MAGCESSLQANRAWRVVGDHTATHYDVDIYSPVRKGRQHPERRYSEASFLSQRTGAMDLLLDHGQHDQPVVNVELRTIDQDLFPAANPPKLGGSEWNDGFHDCIYARNWIPTILRDRCDCRDVALAAIRGRSGSVGAGCRYVTGSPKREVSRYQIRGAVRYPVVAVHY